MEQNTGTKWAEIIADYAMLYIDDERLRVQAAEAPAAFFRRMAILMQAAIPMFSRPPEIQTYLQDGLQAPAYGDSAWQSTPESLEGETEVDTGETEFAVFSCAVRTVDDGGTVYLTPYTQAQYDPDSGIVTFPKQDAEGTDYVMDFYTDGVFGHELTAAQKRILGLCCALVWDIRFTRNWLNIQPKIHDKSFTTVNESSYMTAGTDRLRKNSELLSESLWKYEQDCAYKNTISPTRGLQLFV